MKSWVGARRSGDAPTVGRAGPRQDGRRLPDHGAGALPTTGGEAGQADGGQQGQAVEQRGDPERGALLLQAGQPDGEDGDGDQGADGVGPTGLDGRRAEQGADEGGQQVGAAGARVADLLLRGEQHAGERGDHARNRRRRR